MSIKTLVWLVGARDGKSWDQVGIQLILSQLYPNQGCSKVWPSFLQLHGVSFLVLLGVVGVLDHQGLTYSGDFGVQTWPAFLFLFFIDTPC